MGVSLPISVDEHTNKYHLVVSEEAFDCIQYMFFVYPEKIVKKGMKDFREAHLMDFKGTLELSLRELSVFCSGISEWQYQMDVYQGPRLEEPFGIDIDRKVQSELEAVVEKITSVLRPNLTSETSFYSN